ncbi:DoxX family protein [Actinomadura sp. KC345]|uniref:DoxX family protein n=1 Tax=Actinomadura sp. KC345 TaxID=2530371 RepID=UPI001047E9EA|nr:DoxX family protein [Actinomadura sp. KC345]TDC50885.1 DoxX family protein [Actinomadura sp. KC345]
MRTRPLYDIAAVLARIGVGVVFMAHGWQKIEAGVTATSESFDGLGVPLPTAAAVYSAFVELLGGAALIAGLGLPITGALLFVDMVGAFVFVHAGEGLFLVDGTTVENGFELVLVLGMASLLFAAGGGGRLTVDQWIVRKRLRRPEDDEGEEDAKSFVESLRQAETKPLPKPARKPSSPRQEKPPSAPRQEKAPAPPEPTDPPAGDTGGKNTGTEDDTLVAGRRKSPRRRRAPGTDPGDTGPT